MLDVLVVCGFGKKRELGTGHLIRCLNIIKFLKKKNNIKNIGLAINCDKNKNEAKKIINSFDKKIKTIFFKSKFLANQLNKLSSKLLIVDTLSKLKNSEILDLKKKNKKIILLDDTNFMSSYYDLKINSLLWTKKIRNKKNYHGYEYNIIPSYFEKKKSKEINNKIFIFFGGYDMKNYTVKISNFLSKKKFSKFNFFFQTKYKKIIKNRDNFKYYNQKNFYKHFYSAKIIICSGSLIMFDSIYLNKIAICKAQYKHQSLNIKRLVKLGLVKKLYFNKIFKVFNKIMKSKKQNILTDKKIKFTLNRINNIYIKISNEH